MQDSRTTLAGGFREPIAIIGIGCRYPGVHGALAFWELIRSQRSTVSEPPEHRIALGYDINRYLDPRPRVPGRISSPFAGFLEHPDLFDPVPFGLSPRDVRAMEPQQRLMVEAVWDAIVDAGIPPASLQGERVAVILGHMAEDYSRERIALLGEDAVNRSLDVFTVMGMSRAVLSGRISFLLGVTGPSLTLDTACSSSLIATHLACQSLWSGESRLALAGGVNLFLTPEGNIALSRSGMLAPDGHCKAFDARADGFVRAEGAGVVLLRPLADALAADDPIYAVIRGTGISTDGRDGGHMMAPGRHGQAQAMRDAYACAGVSPADVDFVETHGTGTRIGDPVEIAALADVLGPGRSPTRPLRVSSVKGHIGHTESASGVAGLISATLALAHRELPAQLHFREPNPQIPWDSIPVRVQTTHEAWPGSESPRLAAVNSFGISGTNAHVVLEESPKRAWDDEIGEQPGSGGSLLFPFSAHDDRALDALLRQTAERLRGDAAPRLVDLAYTLGCRREHHNHRFATQASSRAELLDEIAARLAGRPSAASASGQADARASDAGLVLVFPGQGAQTSRMGRALYANEPAFRRCIDELDAAYSRHTDWSLVDALRDPDRVGTLERLSRLQPTLIAVEIALAAVWSHWGIRPDFVVGQSLGEIAAAHVAGCLDVATVARLACHRGEMVERVAGAGAMALVGLDEESLAEPLRPHAGRLEIAGSSSPSSTIVSGDRGPIEALLQALGERGIFARLLDVDFASHCFQMDPLLGDFAARLEGLRSSAGTIPFYSTVEPGPRSGEALDAGYWVRNLRAPVQFRSTLQRLLEDGARRFIEVSPHPTLARAIPETAASLGIAVETIASGVRQRDERATLLTGLGQLYARGSEIDFASIGPRGRTLRSDPYPYQRRRFWFATRSRAELERASHPLLGRRIGVAADPDRCVWEKTIDADDAPFLDDYRIGGRCALPAAVAVEALLAAACEIWPATELRLRNVVLWPLREFAGTNRVTLQIELRRRTDGGQLVLRTRALGDDEWRICASAEAQPLGSAPPPDAGDARTGQADDSAPASALTPDDWHARLEDHGVDFGPRMRSLRALTARHGGIEARLSLARLCESESHSYFGHPALLETAWALASSGRQPVTPTRIDELHFAAPLESELVCRIEPAVEPGAGASRIELRSEDGRTLIVLSGVHTRPIGQPLAPGRDARVSLHRIVWRELETPAIPESAIAREWILCGPDEAVSRLASELHKLGCRCHRGEAALDDFDFRSDSFEQPKFGLAWLGDRPIDPADPRPDEALEAVLAEWLTSGIPIDAVWRITASTSPGADALCDGSSGGSGGNPSGPARVRARLDRNFSQAVLARLVPWMLTGTREAQLVERNGSLCVARVIGRAAADGESWSPSAQRRAAPRQFAARVISPGEPGGFEFREQAMPEPTRHQVRVAVAWAAPSRRAIERLLGLPGPGDIDDPTLHADLVGQVTACGEAVDGIQVGDRVTTSGPLARNVCVDARAVARCNGPTSGPRLAAHARALATAAALLADGITLAPGRSIMVHDPDGELGWATLALIRRAGATAFATATNVEDAATLKSLGIERIDTLGRSDWTTAIRDANHGAPLDSLINFGDRLPIAGDLEAIRAGGSLLDVRSRDRSDEGPVAGLRIRDGRSVSAGDPDRFARDGGTPWSDRLNDAVALLDSITERLPAPRIFPIADLERALRFAAQRRGGGRVVVDFSRADELEVRGADGRPRLFDADARYALLCDEPAAAARISDWMRARGAGWVGSIPGDAPISQLQECGSGAAGLRGIVVLESTETTDRPIAPRGHSRESEVPIRSDDSALDRMPDEKPFVLRLRSRTGESATARARSSRAEPSTIAKWCEARTALGMPVCDVQWLGEIPLDLVEQVIEAAFSFASPDGAYLALADPSGERRTLEHSDPLFDEIRETGADRASTEALGDAWACLPRAERTARIVAHLGTAVAGVLGMGESDRARILPGAGLDELGLDSLMTLELAVGLHRELGVELSRDDLFAPGLSLQQIAESIGERIGPGSAP